MCDSATLKKCKKSLLEEQKEIWDDIDLQPVKLNSNDGGNPYPSLQTHMAAAGTDANERTKSFFFASRTPQNLNAVNSALGRIANDNFGFCTNKECNNDGKIENARLLAMPTAHLCMVCDPEFPEKN